MYQWKWASLVAQLVKKAPAMQKTPTVQEIWVWSLGPEDPLEKEMTTHSTISCLENSMDREACWATVHGVAKSWTRLSVCAHTHTHTHKDITLEQPPKKSHQCSVFLAAIIFLLLHLKFPALFTLHSGECCLGFFFHLLPNHKLPGLVHVGAADGKMDLKEKKKKKKKQSKERVREGSSSYHCFQQPQDSSCPELSKAGSISPFTLPNKCSHCKCKALALFLWYFLDLSFWHIEGFHLSVCVCVCL